jgi:hypothetical protein
VVIVRSYRYLLWNLGRQALSWEGEVGRTRTGATLGEEKRLGWVAQLM